MNLLRKKLSCDQCKSKFDTYKELINHVRHEHHHPIVQCSECGQEFIHEADRLHHARKEHEEKMSGRSHKYEHKHEIENPTPQDEVDAHTHNFGDNF